jgi:threonine/homoserine/homoserine lactone efflux protein
MPTLSQLIGFLITSIVIIAIPGPSVVFSVGRTLALGRTTGLLTVLGNTLGGSMWLLATAFGVSTLLGAFPWLLAAVKIAGAAYLGYLGFNTVRKSGAQQAQIEQSNLAPQSSWTTLKQGFLVGLSNPKVAVFFLAVLPQFINETGNFTLQFVILGLTFEVLGTIGDSIYVVTAALVRDWILVKPARLGLIVRAGGTMIMGLAAWLLIASVLEVH